MWFTDDDIMETKNYPLCIIPAKGNSERLPNKNISLLDKKPLISYAIEKAIKSNLFEKICVSSESKEILDISSKYKNVVPLKRSVELTKNNIQIRHVCEYILKYFIKKNIYYKEFAVILTTNPLTDHRDIKSAYNIFKNKNANSVISVVQYIHPIQRALNIDKNGEINLYFGIKNMKQTQLLDKFYHADGSILICKTKEFLRNKEFYMNKTYPYIISNKKAVDIDTHLDLEWANFLYKKYHKGEKFE